MPRRLLTLELSARCNLRCPMCSLERFYEQPGFMGEQVLAALAPHLAAFDDLDFGVTGEPLLHPDFAAVARRVRAAAPAAFLHVVTNVTALTEPSFAALFEAGVQTVSVSLDAAAAAGFRRTRTGDWGRALAWLGRLARARRAGGGPALHSTFTLQRRNYRELPAFLALCDSLDIRVVHLNNVEVYFARERPQSWCFSMPEDGPALLAEARLLAAGWGIVLHEPRFAPAETPGCRFVGPHVGWQGDVTPCAALSYERPYLDRAGEWRRYRRAVLGNVCQAPLPELWAQAAGAAFAALGAGGPFPPACEGCNRRYGLICG